MSNKGQGWHNHPYNHALASRGIRTAKEKRVDKGTKNELFSSDFENIVRTSLYSDKIFELNKSLIDSEYSTEVAFQFLLEPYEGSELRNAKSTIRFIPHKGRVKIDGELRFPYDDDDKETKKEVRKVMNEVEKILSEKGFKTNSWVISKSITDPKLSSHIHFTITDVNRKYIMDYLEAINNMIEMYYEGVIDDE